MGLQNGHVAWKSNSSFWSMPILEVNHPSYVEQFLSMKALLQLNNQRCNNFKTLLFHSFDKLNVASLSTILITPILH
jgi:hypothetical protein